MARGDPRDWMWSEALQMLARAEGLHREVFRPRTTPRLNACCRRTCTGPSSIVWSSPAAPSSGPRSCRPAATTLFATSPRMGAW